MTNQQQAPHYPKAPRLRINVTQEAIDKAIPKNSGHCMIADSIKDQYPWAKAVSVDIQTIRKTDSRRGVRYIYLTPHKPAENLLKWDYGTKPTPYEFTVREAHVVSSGNRVAKLKTHGGQTTPLPKKATIRKNKGSTKVPTRVGGKEPPNYSVRREFGLRAFKGMTGVG